MENHLPASLAVTVIRISMSDSPQRLWGPSSCWAVQGLPGLSDAELRKGCCAVCNTGLCIVTFTRVNWC